MCGRFSLDITKPDIVRRFRVAQTTIRLASHFNVCPGMLLPVILEEKDEETWLKPEEKTDIIRALLCPYNENDMFAYRVSRDVNNPANDTKTLIHPYMKV
jgi:putative SOS response-associated peptidase YedK